MDYQNTNGNIVQSELSSIRTGQDLMRMQFQKLKEEFNFRQLQDDGSMNFSVDADKYSHQNSITAEKQQDQMLQNVFNNGEIDLKREKKLLDNQGIKNVEIASLQSSGQFIFLNSAQNQDFKTMSNFDKDKLIQFNSSNKCVVQDSMISNENFVANKTYQQFQRESLNGSQITNLQEKVQTFQGELVDTKNNNASKDLFQTKKILSIQNSKRFQFSMQLMVIAKKFISKLKKSVSSIVFKQITRKQFNIIGDLASYFDYYVYSLCMIQSEPIYENGEIIRNRKNICQRYFWDFLYFFQNILCEYSNSFNYKNRKDLFVAAVFIHSRKQAQEDGFSKYLDYIVFVKYMDIPQKLEDITTRLQVSQTAQNWLKLVKLEFIVLLLVHIACCIFLRIGLSELENDSESWLSKFEDQNFTTFEYYLLSLYYIIITMTTIGYGDITPVTQYERMFIALVALIATNICAYSFSQINEIVKYEKSKNENFNNMMHGLNISMNKLELEISLQHKVRKYFEFQYKQEIEGAQGQEQLLEQLPSSLKNEVLLQTNNEAIQSIVLFQNFSSDCQKQISLNIKQKYFKPDELIFNENEINDKLFYVISGNVQTTIGISLKIENTTNINEMQLEILKVNIYILMKKSSIKQTFKKKDVFGYEGFILGQKNQYTAKSYKGAMISYIERDRLIQILQSFPLDKNIYKQDNKIDKDKPNKIEISNCIACGSTSHTLKRCHIVQLNLIYKKDKKCYFQPRDQSFKRMLRGFLKSLKNNKLIQEQIINFKMVSDQNSIMSDVYSVLYSDEDEDSTSKQSKQTNEDEDFSQKVEKNRKQTFKKNTYLNPVLANELVDVYRRRSQKEISFNLVTVSSPKSFQGNSNLQAIDEGEGESERETLKSQNQIKQEKLKINLPVEDGQNSRNESLQNSTEKMDSFLNNVPTPKLNIEKPVSIEISIDAATKLSQKKPTIKSKKNSLTSIHQSSNRKLTGPSQSSNQKTQSTIGNEHNGKPNQLVINNMNTSINVEMHQNEEFIHKKRAQQKKQTKDSNLDDNNNQHCTSDENDSHNTSYDSNNGNNIRQMSLQQRILLKRRKKYEQTYFEEENKIRSIVQQSNMTQLEANLFNLLLPSSQTSQGKINTDEIVDLPSPTQLLLRKHRHNNQVQFDIQQHEVTSPTSIFDSKRRKSSKKITSSSNSEKRLSITGLNKSNSILYKQVSLASKVNQHADNQKDEILSPVSISKGNKKINPQTMVMINSTPTLNRETSDYKIRFEQGIQNIDLLVIRKQMMIEQIKGNIKDFIFVQDNEMDIDKMHKCKIYFPKGNFSYILTKFKIKYGDLTKTKFMTSQAQKNNKRVSKIIKPLNVSQVGQSQGKLQNSRIFSLYGHSASSRNSFNEKDK